MDQLLLLSGLQHRQRDQADALIIKEDLHPVGAGRGKGSIETNGYVPMPLRFAEQN